MSRNAAAHLLRDPYAVIRRPVLSEKTHAMLPVAMETGKEERARYVFDVHPKATKHQVKRAVEEAFGVKVASVNTLVVKPKSRSFRMQRGRATTGMTRLRKRAIIRLAKGSKAIDVV